MRRAMKTTKQKNFLHYLIDFRHKNKFSFRQVQNVKWEKKNAKMVGCFVS